MAKDKSDLIDKKVYLGGATLEIDKDSKDVGKTYDYYVNKELPSKQIESEGGIAPYFTEFIRRELEKIDDELNINLYKDGLIINTTLDSRVQKI